MDTSKLIESLKVEIQKEKNEVQKAEQLLRLQDIAKIYNGDDRVVSSEELMEQLKNTPEKEK